MTSEAPERVDAVATRINELSQQATADGNHDFAAALANEAENLHDLHLSLVAAVEVLIVEEAIDWVRDHDADLADKMKAEAKTADAVRSFAALEARDKQVREEALREAADYFASVEVDRRTADTILALIDEGDTDE